jgi:hypothetical protein
MSFLDDIVSVGSSLLGYVTGSSVGSQLARTAITGYALNQLSKSINKDNQTATTEVDPGVRQQVEASTDNSIPVVYGTAWLGGIITDAELTTDNATMYYCITLCEKTGNTGLGSGAASVFQFKEIYRDDMRLIFENDGITVKSEVDREGNICTGIAGNVKVYCFAGNSSTPVSPSGYTNASLANADTIMPSWGANHDMSNLIFAIVRVDYDATNDIKSLGTFKFKITNSMTQPGDCLYDYMTNTTYGAGIPPAGIYIS